MPSSRRSKTKPAPEIVPSSQKLGLIDSWLQKMLDRFPEKGTITESEVEDFHRDLTPHSLPAIEYGFEAYRRSAIFFPKNGQILDLCISYDGLKYPNTTKCDSLCKSRHGKGYSETDVKYLWEIYQKKKDSLPSRPMTDTKIDSLLDELDRKRGFPPEWRKSA